MNRTQKILLISLVVGVAGIAFLLRELRQPPLLPADADHRLDTGEACVSCHGPTGSDPRGPNHPLGEDCLRCHGLSP
ncbi:MAG: hypothetical protein OES25_10155 [Acidobacteriota bacterium]|nr:hypothetical protein [Acidobacteriota bacterium]